MFAIMCDQKETLMSKGNGRIQRDLLALLTAKDAPVDTFELAAEVYKIEPDDKNCWLISDTVLGDP
jgi:hypothetical protein